MILLPLLQEYLIENGNLPLRGIGKLTFESEPASFNETDKTFIPPDSQMVFSETVISENELQQLTAFIAGKLSISNDETKYLLEKETRFDTELNVRNEAGSWPGWNLLRDKKNNSDFNPKEPIYENYLPVFPIEKVFRPSVTVEVPETPSQPTEIVLEDSYPEGEERVAKDYWWVWAIAISVISILLILFR